MTTYQKNIFCKGIICDKWNRRHKCFDCGVYVCGSCEIPAIKNKKIYCPNCYFKTFGPDWKKLNTEFDSMMLSLNKDKEIKVNIEAKNEKTD